jgi:hypothetical protein
MTEIEGSAAVAVGIDAAVVANHHIVVRRPEAGRTGTVVEDFVVPPTLAGAGTVDQAAGGVAGRSRCRGADIDDVAAVVGRPRRCRGRVVARGQPALGPAAVRVWRARTSPTRSTPWCCPVPASSSSCARPAPRMRPSWPCDGPRNAGARPSWTPIGACAASCLRPAGRSPLVRIDDRLVDQRPPLVGPRRGCFGHRDTMAQGRHPTGGVTAGGLRSALPRTYDWPSSPNVFDHLPKSDLVDRE